MRILVLNQYFHPDVASTAQILTELCEDLARHHDVTVVCGRPSYDPVEHPPVRGFVAEDRHDGVRVLRTWSTSFNRGNMAGRLANYATYVASSMAGAVRAARPDVVVAMTDPPVIAASAASVAVARRVPFVYIVQDLFPQVGVAMGRIRSRAVVRGLDALNRSLRRRAAAVVAIGRDMSSRLRELGVPSDRVHVIPNWADGTLIRPLEGRSPLRAELGLEGSFVVMHSGNLGFSQDLETLLDAAWKLRDEGSIRFVIVGNGAARLDLVRRAHERRQENLVFLDYQPKSRLTESLGAADLHVIGLRRGLAGLIVPSKLYGIMAAGRPFIAAVEKGSEVALVADEFGCGARVEPGDPEELAAAILELRNDAGRLDVMGRRGREALEQHFDRTVASASYLALLDAVVGTRQG